MDKKDVKILAMYLPQYHVIPENSKFWGKDFTDWVTVRKAVPLYEGHNQPQEPLDDNYYDLSKKNAIAWQIEIAKNYNVYGFGIYHYWFSDNKVLLTKPAELILNDKDLDIPYFFAWDNANWRRSWSRFRGNAWAPLEDKNIGGNLKKEENLLVKYELGDKKSWKKHFDYLLPYFKDDRYIKICNRPLFEIFNYSDKILEMSKYWDELALQNGFSGIEILYKHSALYKLPEDALNFCYEPLDTGWGAKYKRYLSKGLSILKIENFGPVKYSYDRIWMKILNKAKKRTKPNELHGAFVSYDDTPRRGKQGRIITGASPEKFKKYLLKLMEISAEQNKEYIILTAWNEWGEGAMLEPSKKDGYDYIDAIRQIYAHED